MSFRSILFIVALTLVSACDVPRGDTGGAGTEQSADGNIIDEASFAAIDSAAIRAHIATLSSDAFEGRGTGTRGEELTINYIRDEMQRLGLEGAMPDGSFSSRCLYSGLVRSESAH